jgi:hypothetical protein
MQGDSAELTVYIPCVRASACVCVCVRIYSARMVIKKNSPPARGQSSRDMYNNDVGKRFMK